MIARTRLLAPLAAVALGCGGSAPIVAPLRYGPVAPPPEEAFRATPPDATPVVPSIALPFRIERLANGLEVVVLERHGLPLASVEIVAARGSADAGAPADAFAILHRVLDAGSRDRSATDLSLAFARLGAPRRAFVSEDGCRLAARVRADDLDAAISLLAEVATRPRLDPSTVATARATWIQDSAQSPGSPTSVVQRNATALTFGRGHPYAFTRPPRAHAEALGPAEIEALHARIFHPANVTLIVVGDVTPEAVLASASRWLGGWSTTAPPAPRAEIPPSADRGAPLVFVEHRGSRQVDATVVARGPDAGSPDLPAFQVLAEILGGTSSRLRGEVRVERGAAYGFGAGVLSLRGGSMLAVAGALDPGKAVPALSTILAALAEIRTRGVPEADFERARTSVLARWRTAAATVDGVAGLAATAVAQGRPFGALTAYPERLASLTHDDVRLIAQTWLGPGAIHVVVAGDGMIEASLPDLGLGPPARRDPWGEPLRR